MTQEAITLIKQPMVLLSNGTIDDLGIVRQAIITDIPYVISLSKKENHSLGFIPKMAYESAVTGIKTGDRWSTVCNDKLFVIECNKDLVGFCIASFGLRNSISKKGKIAQICLQTDARKFLRGRRLLDEVVEYGKTQGTMAFSAGCANDLESNLFWQAMGWVKISSRFGISHKNTWKQTSKRVINIYRYDPSDFLLTLI
jgi:hypothetical protein